MICRVLRDLHDAAEARGQGVGATRSGWVEMAKGIGPCSVEGTHDPTVNRSVGKKKFTKKATVIQSMHELAWTNYMILYGY